MSAANPAPVESALKSTADAKKRKAFWTKQFYLWHWVSSAICLAAMLLFAFTGITLNHAKDIPAKPKVNEVKLVLPEDLAKSIAYQNEADTEAPLPDEISKWLAKELRTTVKGKSAEWSEFEIYLSLPRPGGDAWLTIDRETGDVVYELTKRGAISYLNDLHKGRNTGTAWSLFLDVFSVACIVFCLTGLALLWVHAKRRPRTWPAVIAGILLPVIIIIFFVH
ncbi:PepSY-associated TM helix domain-containing protein [Luteolibacter flavescens]|uniref:PepSY-associated TM helix domain-containing protein n=1 Tax=Luteolibacter flavescens TaxID=1859460 RepID=A0ABT3FHU1_9BACT|nr:PepSY-associated TM helix domain-containing protein [Luteolibacter flavescens]MCW1883138.1 PepSY-associated TM helix domain-containing protein [Luteolibacter flavescens]